MASADRAAFALSGGNVAGCPTQHNRTLNIGAGPRPSARQRPASVIARVPRRAVGGRPRTTAFLAKHAPAADGSHDSSWAIAQAGGSSCRSDSDERFRRKRSCGPVGGRCRCRIRTLGASFPLISQVPMAPTRRAKRKSSPSVDDPDRTRASSPKQSLLDCLPDRRKRSLARCAVPAPSREVGVTPETLVAEAEQGGRDVMAAGSIDGALLDHACTSHAAATAAPHSLAVAAGPRSRVSWPFHRSIPGPRRTKCRSPIAKRKRPTVHRSAPAHGLRSGGLELTSTGELVGLVR
jgi:hypothetical protein